MTPACLQTQLVSSWVFVPVKLLKHGRSGRVRSKTTWCDCGGRSPVANEVRYVGLMDISREENDLWNIMLVWMCH